jgi:hypothetical protein
MAGDPDDEGGSANKLFDLRTIIALLFGVYGLVLVGIGIFGTDDAQRAKSGGTNLNLWTGLAMIVLAVVFAGWVRLRPLHPEPAGEEPVEEPG